jgi:hypothetical protein
MRAILLLLVFTAGSAAAEVYRWVDAKGVVHYSNSTPPPGVKSTVVPIDAKEGPPSVESSECYSVRCQGERMEERIRRRDEAEARMRADRIASAPPPVRGLEFRRYVSIQRGMREGELLGIAGQPDFVSDQGIAIAAPAEPVQTGRNVRSGGRVGLSMKTWTYMPTSADPFTTTITLVGGRVSELERVRKF